MKLDQLVKLYGRQEDVAELAALRARVLELAEDRAAQQARAEAAERKVAAALEECEKWRAAAEEQSWPFEWEVATKLKQERDDLRIDYVSMTARAEAAERKVASALEVEENYLPENSWECRGHIVGILRGVAK